MLRRAVVTWILMIPVAFINGIIRDAVVRPVTGELPAHQLSVATGSTALFALVYAMWHRDADRFSDRSLKGMGGMWLLATILFEFALGSMRGLAWEEMLHDYDIVAGRLWPVVLLVIGISPVAVKRLAAWRRGHGQRRAQVA